MEIITNLTRRFPLHSFGFKEIEHRDDEINRYELIIDGKVAPIQFSRLANVHNLKTEKMLEKLLIDEIDKYLKYKEKI